MKEIRNIEILDEINAIVCVCAYVFSILRVRSVRLEPQMWYILKSCTYLKKNECKQMTIQIHSLYKMCNTKRIGTERNTKIRVSQIEKKNEYLLIIIFKNSFTDTREILCSLSKSLKFHSS